MGMYDDFCNVLFLNLLYCYNSREEGKDQAPRL